MEFHFTVPELKVLTRAIKRDLSKAKENELDSIELLALDDLRKRCERKLKEYEEQKAFKE